MIDQGLRAQLVIESLVTGQLAVELDFHPETPATLGARQGSLVPEIPSIPASLQEIREALESLIAQAQALPLDELVDRAMSSLSAVDELVNSEEIRNIVAGVDRFVNSDDTQALSRSLKTSLESLEVTMDEARGLIRHADQQVDPLVEKLGGVIAQLDATMAETRELLASARYLTGEDSELLARANAGLRELESAMRSLRVLLDYLERHPEAFLRGRGKGEE